jgi:hypothetical protein
MTKVQVPLVGSKPRWAALFGVLTGGALLLAACGGTPPSNASVARIKTTTTVAADNGNNNTGTGGSAGAGGYPAPAGGPGGQSGFAMAGGNQSQMLAFSHCMQTHGVPNFPEPNAQGVIQGNGLNQSSPAFQSASNKCRHVLPNDGKPTAAQEAQAVAQALKFSECMRAHGIRDFPDPDVKGGGAQISIRLGGGPGSDLNPQLPRFQAAQSACQGFMPGPKGAGKFGVHGAAPK